MRSENYVESINFIIIVLITFALVKVILGGGAQVLTGSINDTKSGACSRLDGKDLAWDWMQFQKRSGRKYKYVKDKEQLLSADNDTYLLGKPTFTVFRLYTHSNPPLHFHLKFSSFVVCNNNCLSL